MVFRKEPADNVTPPIANNQNGEFEAPRTRKKAVTAYNRDRLSINYRFV